MTERELLIAEIKNLQSIRSGISATIGRLDNRLTEIESLEFIAEHGVTRDKIELGSWDGTSEMPFFQDSDEFRQWINKKTGNKKPFAEWNCNVYIVGEFMDGKLGNSCRLQDVKE